MKRICLVLVMLAAVAGGGASAQESLADSLKNACAAMERIECGFTQTRRVPMLDEAIVSHGRMSYVKPDRLKWEYTDPVVFVMEMNGTDLKVTGGKNGGAMFRDLAGLLMGAVSGKLISEGRLFETQVSRDGRFIVARLVPRKQELKNMWTCMTMFFDPKTFRASHIDISENGGGVTTIDFDL